MTTQKTVVVVVFSQNWMGNYIDILVISDCYLTSYLSILPRC